MYPQWIHPFFMYKRKQKGTIEERGGVDRSPPDDILVFLIKNLCNTIYTHEPERGQFEKRMSQRGYFHSNLSSLRFS